MHDLNYFLSEDFLKRDEISMEEVWELNALLPVNKFTGKDFQDSFVYVDEDEEGWLIFNGKRMHIKQPPVNELNFF